ncbi:MAG: MoxR family ATPase [candidate division NC10 bacterium]|nr:MoxR family ATPase [candidate division NC10 bacterium]
MQESGEARAALFRERFQRIAAEVGKVIVGHREVIHDVLFCLFCGGHALLEGVPGLGKTLLVKTLSRCLDLRFSRIQFTPDLMPADIIGTTVVVEDSQGKKHFQFHRGPLFGQIVLTDEVNRATPKTQSALLEAMQELAVTVGKTQYPLERPFFVLATQNPIEMEGTYPLPEAQIDRFFFKIRLTSPDMQDLTGIIDRTTGETDEPVTRIIGGAEVETMKRWVREVPIATHLKEYVSRIIMNTHSDCESAPDSIKRFVRYGSSPRGAQALVLAGKAMALLAGRFNVSGDDITRVALPALRHRIILSFEGEAEGVTPDRLVTAVLQRVTEEMGLKILT